MMITRVYLARENKKRETEEYDASHDDVYITEKKEDGTTVEVRVDKVRFSSLLRLYWIVLTIVCGTGVPGLD